VYSAPVGEVRVLSFGSIQFSNEFSNNPGAHSPDYWLRVPSTALNLKAWPTDKYHIFKDSYRANLSIFRIPWTSQNILGVVNSSLNSLWSFPELEIKFSLIRIHFIVFRLNKLCMSRNALKNKTWIISQS
jgi:hypothetical protein